MSVRLASYCANCMVPLYTEPEQKFAACQRCLGLTNAELIDLLREDAEAEATEHSGDSGAPTDVN